MRNIKIHSKSSNVFVHPQSTAPQFGVYSLIPISLNLKLSNEKLPDKSNMTMDRLPVSQGWCSPYISVGLTNRE